MVRWTRNDMVKAGYIDRSVRGVWELTSAGWEVVNPPG
jgi:hypothetical protein